MDDSTAEAQLDGAHSPRPAKSEPLIKTEQSATPRAQSPTSSAVEPTFDEATAKAIALAQNEYSTRRVPKKSIIDRLPTQDMEIKASPVPEEDAGVAPATTATSKKRPAPKSAGANAKGTPSGIKKPPPKKRKLEPSSLNDRATPGRTNRSTTPASTTASSRGGKPVAGKTRSRKSSLAGTPASSSPAPAGSPAPASSEPASDADDSGEVYCICRRPDNHTWMVACDGGCDDWFHGKCVNMAKEDQDLIDKYICPNCTANGRSVTTWKPMCRRDGCRRPARLRKGAESKYCSDECGVLFMRGKTERARAAAAAVARADEGAADDEPDLGPLGGAIRSHELKALAHAAPDAESFRRLGESPVLRPPTTLSPEAQQQQPQPHPPVPTSSDAPTLDPSTTSPTTDDPTTRLASIATLKSSLRQRRALLKDRDRFVALAKERAARLAAATKLKDMCGYDPRLSWADAEFREWRESREGVAAFAKGTLDAAGEDGEGMDVDGVAVNGSVKTEPVADSDAPSSRRPQPHRSNTSDTTHGGDASGASGAVCVRRRCQRHAGWQKLALHDVRFEEAETRAEMRRVDEEEKELRGRVEEGGWGGVNGVGGGEVVDGMDVDVDGVVEVDGGAVDGNRDADGRVNGVVDGFVDGHGRFSAGMGGIVEVVEG